MLPIKVQLSRSAVVVIAVIGVLVLSGCGTAHQDVAFVDGYQPSPKTFITIGEVVDAAPKLKRGDEHKDFDIAGKMREELEAKLRENELLANSAADQKLLVMSVRIVDYEPGSAFKRWLMPGYGKTILTVKGALHDGDRQVATAEAHHSVDAGGLYTAGAWESIFGAVAESLVARLKEKMRTEA